MSLILTFDKKHYNNSQVIPLRINDDWSLDAKVTFKKGTYIEDFDLTNYSASGFFKGVVSEVYLPCQMINAKCGELRMSLAASGTPNVALAPNGTSVYIIVKNTNDNTTQTIETDDEPIEVRLREFRTF